MVYLEVNGDSAEASINAHHEASGGQGLSVAGFQGPLYQYTPSCVAENCRRLFRAASQRQLRSDRAELVMPAMTGRRGVGESCHRSGCTTSEAIVRPTDATRPKR